jgi:hypothetical protein
MVVWRAAGRGEESTRKDGFPQQLVSGLPPSFIPSISVVGDISADGLSVCLF